MIGCDTSRPRVGVCVCVCVWGRERGRERKGKGFVILLLRSVMCWRSCEPPLALWVTYSRAISTWPGSSRVMREGKRLVCVDGNLSNLYTTLAPQPPGNRSPLLLRVKRSVRTGRDMLTDSSIESHYWWLRYEGVILQRCGLRRELLPRRSVVNLSKPHFNVRHWWSPVLVYSLSPEKRKVSLACDHTDHIDRGSRV